MLTASPPYYTPLMKQRALSSLRAHPLHQPRSALLLTHHRQDATLSCLCSRLMHHHLFSELRHPRVYLCHTREAIAKTRIEPAAVSRINHRGLPDVRPLQPSLGSDNPSSNSTTPWGNSSTPLAPASATPLISR
jgi:hypothetical protein